MARRAPKPRSSARRPLWEAINWGAARRGSAAFLWLALVAGLAVAWVFGVPRLAHLAVADTGDPGPLRVSFREQPAWLDGEAAIDLELLVRECVSRDPLDREGLVAARDALLGTGWYRSVAQVRRTSVDGVEIVGTFAEPAALVRSGRRDWLIDAEGRLLPMSWNAGAGPALAVLLGARSGPPEAPGEAWSGGDVLAGLAVLAVIDRQPWARQVAAIDLSSYAADRTVTLVTDRSSTIRWGRPPGSEKAAEVSAAMKLDFLQHHVQRYGHIDGGLAGELDVTQDVAVLRGS